MRTPTGRPESSPFAYLSGSGGGAAAPGYPLVPPRTGTYDGQARRKPPASGPPRAASVASVARETARSMLGSRGGRREPVAGRKCAKTPVGGEERPAPRVQLLSLDSGHFGADWPAFHRDLAPSACPPAQSGASGSKNRAPSDVQPETSCPRSRVRRCGASAAGPGLALGRLMRAGPSGEGGGWA